MGHLIRDVLFPFFPYLISLFLSVEINKTLTPDLTSNMWHQNTAFFSIATVSIWPQMSRSRRSSEFFSSFFIRSFPIITDVPGKLSYHSVSLLVKCGAQSPRKFNCISGKYELNLFPPPTIYYFKIKNCRFTIN